MTSLSWFGSTRNVRFFFFVAGALLLLGTGCDDAGGGGGDDAGAAVCGDGVVTAPERCDDDNAANGDGCSSACSMEPGWTCASPTGPCVKIPDCSGNPCLNGASCANTASGYTCACAAGFSGANCETDVDDCTPGVCQNGGTCIDGIDGYSCTCAAGYTGTTCESEIDECAPNPCLHGGACTDGLASYSCACAPTYTGAQCEACQGSLADCNGSAVDGCESNLLSDSANCNVCGMACTTGNVCSNGACIPTPTTLVPGEPITVAATHGPMAPWVADVDRDGDLDVLVANAESGSTTTPSGSLSVFLGHGDGTLQAEVTYAGAPLSSNAVVAADVDDDGWLDAITVDGQTNLAGTNGSISVFRNLGATAPGTFAAPASFTTGAPGSVHLCAADFDSDGHVDVATVSVLTNQVSVLRGDGAGSFGGPTAMPIVATGGVQSSLGCRDLDRDGHVDLVVTSPSSARVSVLLNQGNATFASPVAYINSQNGQTAGVAFGDADGDGTVDILSNGAAGRYLFFFKGNADGTFASGVQSTAGPAAVANSALGLVASDFNHDGDLDVYILVTTTSGGVRPMTGNGAGAFTSGTVVTTGQSPGANAIATADLDDDGYDDLVLTNRGSSTVTVVPNGL